ncbi:dynamin-related protein 4C-like [Panicum miliaceum]|uniref:Dynamin-related protein 4C-like n=1 Tax=Panicum miliaceum TaxID=4540 RepID=A0A3L6TPK1_PANMI|nr:dynamin-related protein 4C-like [Panicum miliaceum]
MPKAKKRRTGGKLENDVEDAKGAAAVAVASDVTESAIAASYNDQIRPLLDAVDRLRHLKVTQEGIQLPTIVVVGDQSGGKSSVLESLAGISLPRGQGICTRVPLVMRLQDDPSADSPKLQLEYSNGRVVATTEAKVTDAINAATAEIAGKGKGISDAPITLVVRKRGVPDLTLVDLPGITRVPVQGQPEDIYDQIAKIIKDYIAPKESIILNVLSATVDFPTCESIRMSQQVDRTGERTLAVVTKVDKAPEGLLEKVTMDDVNIGLGYVCARNRIGEETYDQARVEEARLFKNHRLLSKIDKSMVGIPVLAQRLMQIQATIIARCLPDIVKQINDRLIRSRTELDQMPPDLNNTGDAVRVFFRIVKKVCTSLEKILVRAEFDAYLDDCYFHGTARMAEMLNRYARRDELFLMEEISVLQETMGINFPNFLPRSAFHVMLKKKVEMVGQAPQDLVNEVWEYVEDLVMKILLQHSKNFPQVQSSCRLAIQSLMEKARARSAQHVKELIEMELVADYTVNPEYMKTWAAVMEGQKKFMESVENNSKPTNKITLEGFGEVDVCHLRMHADLAEQAFDLRARLTAYWKIIVLRLVDGLALHVVRGVKRLVENDLEEELADQLLGNNMAGVERMLSPLPSTGTKRDRLKKTIVLLQQSKEVVANIMDRISARDEV